MKLTYATDRAIKIGDLLSVDMGSRRVVFVATTRTIARMERVKRASKGYRRHVRILKSGNRRLCSKEK